MKQKNKNTKPRARGRLILLAAIFSAPMMIAYFLYYSGWRPAVVHPHGELVTPARPIGDVEFKALDGQPVRFSSLQPRWRLVYFGSSECTSACERALYKIRQIIAAQNREAHRVRGVMVLTDTRALDKLRDQLKDYADITALMGSPANVTRFAREFEIPAGSALGGLHRIYVVDPLGNFLMSYPAEADPSGMRKDLTRLLRLSQIG
jgi:cytochrome oxidase Cu insertion factor (SCO1/SenC/PrrC family)